MSDAAELYERVKWIYKVIAQLWRQKFSGSLILKFHEGNMSRKYSRQIDETAPGD